MLYQDTLTGMLHEVPDSQVGWGFAEDPYGMGEVYDGLGHPLGFGFKKMFRGLVKRALPLAMSISPYGQILKTALPIARRALGPVIASTGQALRQQALRQLAPVAPVAAVAPVVAPVVAEAAPGVAGVPVAMATPTPVVPVPAAPIVPVAAAPVGPGGRRLPVGWRRPPVPYTGLRPRRVYLRCSAWPGPRGLVPVSAATATPAGPAVVTPAVVPGPVRYRRGRRR